MTNIFDKENYTKEDINNLILASTEESINLDFKASGSLDMSDGKKSEVSKDVSSFANSDGGIIIYGLTEKDHKADSFSYIDGAIYTKEWLEQVIISRIKKPIHGIEIHPIRSDNDIKKSIYVVKIPKSSDAPHMAYDKRYYKRYNFLAEKMEEYEVRDLYNRKLNTLLEIDDIIISQLTSTVSAGLLNFVDYKITFQINNIGNLIEERYKIEITLPKVCYLDYPHQNPLQNFLIRHIDYLSIFSVPNNSPIFQKELTSCASVIIRINRNSLDSIMQNGIKVKLYYTNGVKEKTFDLKDRLSFQGTLLVNTTFNI